jgi:hypothetical protein
MAQGEYLLYERASRDEERLFLEVAKEAVEEVQEPSNWRKLRDPEKHAGGKPIDYQFKPMLLTLLLMNYHRKEYREMEAHLKNSPHILRLIGLKKAPSKSTIQRAHMKIGISMLTKLNDTIIAKFKKDVEEDQGST